LDINDSNMKFKEKDLPVKDLRALNLHDGKRDLLPEDVKKSLLNGDLTDFVALRDIPVNGKKISLDAKLSLREAPDGRKTLLVHPIYARKQEHPLLTEEENGLFEQKGTHAKKTAAYGTIIGFGRAPYRFEEGGGQSFFVRLQKDSGQRTEVWGAGLERAMEESKKAVGEKAQLEMKDAGDGKKTWEVRDYAEGDRHERTFLFEYDRETKSFVGVDAEKITVPETLDGQQLTPEQKRDFREGRPIAMPDGTSAQASPKEKNGIRSNRRMLIASVLLDGGISFLLYHAIKALVKNRKTAEQKERDVYSKGYLDAINKVRADLQKRLQLHPKDRQAARDIAILDGELAMAGMAIAGTAAGIGHAGGTADGPAQKPGGGGTDMERTTGPETDGGEEVQRTGYGR